MTKIVDQVVVERRTELLNDGGTRWWLVATTSVLPGLRRPRRSKDGYPLLFRTLYAISN